VCPLPVLVVLLDLQSRFVLVTTSLEKNDSRDEVLFLPCQGSEATVTAGGLLPPSALLEGCRLRVQESPRACYGDFFLGSSSTT
jgi:hypothetical protein